MGFLNATLLFGMAISAIPIALHLLGRKEPRRYEFPAVRFLTQRFETTRQRLRVRHWSLLALRVLALAGLAAAMAQPHISEGLWGTWLSIGGVGLLGLAAGGFAIWGFLTGKSKQIVVALSALAACCLAGSIVWAGVTVLGNPAPVVTKQAASAVAIVFDNSPRSLYQTEERSRLEEARDWANWIIDHFSEDSLIAVVDRSARPITPAIDMAAARRSIQKTKALQTVQPLQQRLDAAIAFVQSSKLEQKAVYVVTDLAEESWLGERSTSVPEDVTIRIVDVGDPVFRNVGFSLPQIASATTAVDSPASVTLQIIAEGEISKAKLPVELKLFQQDASLPVLRDGETVYPIAQTVDRREVDLIAESEISQSSASEASRSFEVTLAIPPLKPGIHHAEIVIANEDPLEIDNRRFLTLYAEQAPKILIVSNNESEADVIKRALEASSGGGTEFRVDTARTSEVQSSDLSRYEAVGVLDPPRDNLAWQEALLAWVQGGGQLFVSLGPSWADPESDAAFENSLIGNSVRQWRVPEPGHFVSPRQSTHPALAPLAPLEGQVPWQASPIYRYWQIENEELDITIARFSGSNHPALIDRKLGDGRMLLLTTPIPGVDGPSRRWNELFSGEEFLPAFLLVRGVFAHLARRDPGTLNVVVGQPVGLKHKESAATRYQLFAPRMPPVAVDASNNQIVPGPPKIAGHYWLRNRDGQAGFSANIAEEATRLMRVDSARLDDMLGADRYKVVRQRDEMDWSLASGASAQPFYAQILLMICGIFVLEQFLSNRFYA